MWTRFMSSSVHKVDAKGRVSVPSSFRRVLRKLDSDDTMILVPEFRRAGTLEGFAPAGFEALLGRMEEMYEPTSAEYQTLERRLVAAAQELKIDETGRIVLPQALRAVAGIEGEALFAGASESFRIWNPGAYEAHLAAVDAELPGPEDAMALLPRRARAGAGAGAEGGEGGA